MALNLGLRPRIALTAKGDPDELRDHIRDAAGKYQVVVARDYLVIKIPGADCHYWSPQLQVTLNAQEDHVRINGLLTPMPAVWTLFAWTYILIATMGFFATIYGLAQHTLGQAPYALWAFPVTLILIGFVYIASMYGQRIGHDQSEELTTFLQDCLEST